MSLQKIANYAKHFDVTLLHDEILPLPFSETAKHIFRRFESKTISEAAKEPAACHLLIVCISSETAAQLSQKGKFPSLQRLESVLFSPDFLDPSVLHTALSLRSLSAVDLPQNEENFVKELTKIFPHLIKKYNESLLEGYYRTVAEQSDSLFLIQKGGKILYGNDRLKERFGSASTAELEHHLRQGTFGNLLTNSVSNQQIIPIKHVAENTRSDYLIHTTALGEGEMMVAMVPLRASLRSDEKKLLNRMNFIERLKDAFLIHAGEHESIPIVMIHIENSEKIILQNGENIYNEICKKVLLLAQDHFDKEADIAQWHKDVYTVISPRTSISALKQTLEVFHKEVSEHVAINNAIPSLNSFVIDMHGVDLNKAIAIIDHIHQKQLLSADIANLVYHEVSATHHELDEKDQAQHYLEKMILTKSPIKLLNFYKGIRISTPARLVKLAEGSVYVAIEKIQGYAMKLEESVVIQSANMPFDLQAKVKIVDVGKKITVLSNFQPLKASANNRQYIRIQSDHRMHVTLTSSNRVTAGTIMDISIKSIACKVSTAKSPPDIGTPVIMQFNLPLARLENGMANMSVKGSIQYVQAGEEFTKVVVDLNLQEPYESYMIDYIYNRQQALISEIKSIANKL